MATNQELKEIMRAEKTKKEKALERELSYKKELDDDKAVLTYVQNLVDTGKSLPPECSYSSFTEWTDSIKKEIKSGETSLKNIELDKNYIQMLEYIINDAKDEPTV